MGRAVQALRTCLFTDTVALTHSYMPDDIVGRAPNSALPTIINFKFFTQLYILVYSGSIEAHRLQLRLQYSLIKPPFELDEQ